MNVRWKNCGQIAALRPLISPPGANRPIVVRELLNSTPLAYTAYENAFQAAMQFISDKEFVGTVDFVESKSALGESRNGPFSLALGNFTYWGSMSVTGTLDELSGAIDYSVVFKFHLWDPYDWNPNVNALSMPYILAQVHLQGDAKQYLHFGSAPVTVNWQNTEPLPNVPAP